MRHNFFTLLLAFLTAGCATSLPPSSRSLPLGAFPPDGLVTQRAILTVRGQQFALNGYLSQSVMGGQRLIITETFGHVLADVLVEHDGSVHVMRSSKLLHPPWIRNYVVADMQLVFGGATNSMCSIQKLSATHFMIQHRWNKLDLQIVEIKPGLQPRELFDYTHEGIP